MNEFSVMENMPICPSFSHRIGKLLSRTGTNLGMGEKTWNHF